jgi:hypothetical protein
VQFKLLLQAFKYVCDARTGTTGRPLFTAELVVWLDVVAPLGLLTADVDAPKTIENVHLHH